jgi:proteasome lid subunit RPN8/RPN11
MVMVLEQKMINQIARIGKERMPNEACGLLLPMAIAGRQVIELPNRSKTPRDSFEMRGEDMVLALEMLLQGPVPENMIPSLTAWHTHPGGNVGPSRADMKQKPAHMSSLVVAIYEDKPPVAAWF